MTDTTTTEGPAPWYLMTDQAGRVHLVNHHYLSTICNRDLNSPEFGNDWTAAGLRTTRNGDDATCNRCRQAIGLVPYDPAAPPMEEPF